MNPAVPGGYPGVSEGVSGGYRVSRYLGSMVGNPGGYLGSVWGLSRTYPGGIRGYSGRVRGYLVGIRCYLVASRAVQGLPGGVPRNPWDFREDPGDIQGLFQSTLRLYRPGGRGRCWSSRCALVLVSWLGFSFGWWLFVVGASLTLSGWGGSAVAYPRSRGCSRGGYCDIHHHPTLFGPVDARRVVALGVVVGLWWSLQG